MNEVVRFLIFGIPLTALGIFVDRVLLRRHKVSLHESLLRFWLKIDEASFPDLAKRISTRVAEAFVASTTRPQKMRTVITLITLSWLITSLASSIGAFMDGIAEANPYTWLPIFPVYFVNGFFDALTLGATFLALRLTTRAHSAFTTVIVAGNAIAAAVIAIFSLPLLVWSHNEAYTRNWPGSGDAVPSMLFLTESSLGLEAAFLPQIERHVKEHPGQPFVFDKENWTGPDGTTAKSVHVKIDFPPGATFEQYKTALRVYKRELEKSHQAALSNYTFTNKYTFKQFYADNLRNLIFEFRQWYPKIEGSIESTSPTGSSSAKGVTIPSGKWVFVLIAGTTLIPITALAFVLVVLAGLKVTRDSTAWMSKYFIERATEDDPRIAPEKFAPFTLLLTVVSLALYIFREFTLWIADKFI